MPKPFTKTNTEEVFMDVKNRVETVIELISNLPFIVHHLNRFK